MVSRGTYDVVVVGGGHAGIEAASAAARMGARTALITHDLSTIGRLSCNPAIGGMAKGQLVCEIDALGGEMARLADRSGLQFKTLGTKKGPAMWSPRSQNDKDLYPEYARHRLEEIDGLDLLEAGVADVVLSNGSIAGISLENGQSIACRAVVLCAGTFLCGRTHAGEVSDVGGRIDERSAEALSGSLRTVGFETGRLKTGTPPRLDADSVDYGACREDHGDPNPRPFSADTPSVANQITCWTTSTNPDTHRILEEGLDRSPMFAGRIQGRGPRYCPSIEDKIFRFSDKEGHHLFLEPEGLQADTIYVNGFSTSLPLEIQERALATVPGLQTARIVKKGYAVEYDYFPPYQLKASLESRLVGGLFMAGQINGTSGYEEAAAQGLMAGINAVLALRGEDAFVLKRSEAYIGVLLDDLATLSTDEPYRMFTSRAEYRLLLRRDNADLRLSEFGYRLGLVSDERIHQVRSKRQGLSEGLAALKSVTGQVVNGDDGRVANAWQLLKNPDLSLQEIDLRTDTPPWWLNSPAVREQLEISARYEGYIERQMAEAERMLKEEEKQVPESVDYSRIHGLSTEGREKLSRIRPRSIGQASRISGVSRSDLSVLMIYLR